MKPGEAQNGNFGKRLRERRAEGQDSLAGAVRAGAGMTGLARCRACPDPQRSQVCPDLTRIQKERVR